MTSNGERSNYSVARLHIERLSRWIDGGSGEFSKDFKDLTPERQFLIRTMLSQCVMLIEETVTGTYCEKVVDVLIEEIDIENYRDRIANMRDPKKDLFGRPGEKDLPLDPRARSFRIGEKDDGIRSVLF